MARVGKKPRRLWRWPLYLLLSLLVLLAFFFVALRTSFAREQIRKQTNLALSQLFHGKIQIDRIGEVTLGGVRGVDARIFDPQSRQVIRVQGLRATASLPRLAWQLVSNAGAPALYIDSAHIDFADVSLREDQELGVTIAETFLPRESATVSPPSAPGSGPRLQIGEVTIDRVWAHGRAAGSPLLDADLKQLKASLRQSPVDGFSLDLDSVELVTRALPTGADPGGKVAGIIEVPAGDSGPLRLEGTLDGHAAGSPLALEASWVGDALHARVRLQRLPAAFVNERAPGLLLDGDLTVDADVDGLLPQLDFQAEIDGTAAHAAVAGYAVVASGMELAGTVDVTRVDLKRVVSGAPASSLDLRVSALVLEQEDGHFIGSHRAEVERGRIEQLVTPALWVTGKDRLDTQGDVEAVGKLGATDPGAAVNGAYRVSLPREGPQLITASLQAVLDEPVRLRERGVHTVGKVSVSGELRPDARTLTAKASVSLRHLDQSVFEARNVEAVAQVSGSLDDPHVHAAATLDLLSGRAHADLEYTAASQQLDVFAADLDLVRLSHVLGSPLPIKEGNLGLDARLSRSARSPRYVLDATANAGFGKLGQVNLVAKGLELPSSAPTLSRPGTLQGELLATGKLELEALSPLLVEANLPIERTTGHVRFEIGVKQFREDPRGLELSVLVDTNGLRIVQERKTPHEIKTTAEAIDSRPTALEGIDLHLSARTWPQTGEAVGTLILRDAAGTLAVAQAETQLASLWPAGLGNVDALARLPLKATLQMPTRRLGSLPPLLRPAALRGRLSLDVTLEGSAAEPQIEAKISADSLRASGAKDPVDVEADVTYAASGGKAKVLANLTRTHAQVADVSSEWHGDLRRAGELAGGRTGLTASADIKLREFPLDVVPEIIDRQVNGRLTADVKLVDWGKDARVDAKLSSTTLVVGQIPIQGLTVSARTDADRLLGEVGMQVGAGSAKGTLDAGMHWGKRPLPELEHRGSLKLSTQAFQLETLSPLLGGYVSEIGGVLDASTEVAVTPDSTALSGSARLEKGVFQLPALGQRFSDISARVAVADNQFKLARLEARGTTGRLSATGAARLDGFELRGADAHVVIAKNEALPITLEGSALGDAWGNVNATYVSPAQGERKLDIDVPDFHLLTPDSGGHGLQSLDDDKEIRVGVRRADGVFVALPVQPLDPGGAADAVAAAPAQPLRVQIKLGNNVSVERGRTAQAQLTGQLVILTGVRTEVDGRIEVRGGKLDVSGKTFEIERGVVTFEGDDPSNPTITATARWDAPGYTVYAEYLGDVQNGRIKLHAEPPLTQDEIASLLLFGTPEGAAGGSADPAAASLAVSVAGDTAAKGLNQVLDDFTNLDVSARIDTTTGTSRPELVFQISPRVSAKVTRAIGAPAAGESPDRTFLTLELRLKRAWALSAVFGDHGASALDLIWRRRY